MDSDLISQSVAQTVPDRRRHPRYRFSAPITIRSGDNLTMQGISIEISRSGMSAITADALTVNETVELEPIATGKVLAKVRRVVGRVYGFEFLDLTDEQGRRITEICKSLPLYHGKSLGI
ncbi:MAG: PilZ domain-containing protein [Terriglobales bacterium]